MASNFTTHSEVFSDEIEGSNTTVSLSSKPGREDDSDKDFAIEAITNLTPLIIEVSQHEINEVLDKARGAGLIGDGMYDKFIGGQHDSKEAARSFLNVACTHIKMDYKTKFEAFLKIFRETRRLEIVETKIEEEKMKLTRSKSREKKEELQKVPSQRNDSETGSISVFGDEISTNMVGNLPSMPLLATSTSSGQVGHSEKKGDIGLGASVPSQKDETHQGTTKSSVQSFIAHTGSSTDIPSEVTFQEKGIGIEEEHTSSTRCIEQITVTVPSTKSRSSIGGYERAQRLIQNEKEGAKFVTEESNKVILQYEEQLQKFEIDQMPHRQDVTDKFSSKVQEVQKKKKDIQNYMEDIQKKETEMEEMKEKYEGKLEKLKRKHEEKIDAQAEQIEKEKDDLKREYEKDMEKFIEAVERAKKDAKLEEEKLKLAHVVDEKTQIINYEKKISDLKEVHGKQISELKEMISNLKENLSKSEIEKKVSEKVISEKEAQLREADLKQKMEVMELRHEFERKAAALLAATSSSSSSSDTPATEEKTQTES